MRKKEFIIDNCKFCQYGGANGRLLFGKYFKSLQKFFDKSKADDIIKILGDNIKFKDLNIILTEFEAQGTDSNISILERFEQLGMVEKKANFVKSILQGYQKNNRDFSEKISKNNPLKTLYNDQKIIGVFSEKATKAEATTQSATRRTVTSPTEVASIAEAEATKISNIVSGFEELPQKEAMEASSVAITSYNLLYELNQLKTKLCEKYGGVSCISSDNEVFINPMSNKFIDGIQSNRKAAANIAKIFVNNLKYEELSQIIKNSENKSFFHVEQFIKIYNQKTLLESKKKNRLGEKISRKVVGKLVGEYSGKVYLDTVFAVKFLMNFFYTSGWGGSSVHTIADKAYSETMLSGKYVSQWDQRLYGMWEKYKSGFNWTNYISSLKPRKERLIIYTFKMKTIEIDNLSPIATEFLKAKTFNEANKIVEFIEHIVIMTIFITVMINIIPMLGTSFFATSNILSAWNPLVAVPIYKSMAFLFGIIVKSLSYSMTWISKLNLRKGYFNFKSFIRLKYINSQLKRKKMNDISLEYNSIYNKVFSDDILRNYIPPKSTKKTSYLLNELHTKIPEFVANEMIHNEINHNIDHKVTSKYLNYATLTYNNNKSINNLFKKNFIKSIFEAISFLKEDDSTPSGWDNLNDYITIKIDDLEQFKSIDKIENCTNVMLKKFYISCFYVVLLYLKKNVIKLSDKNGSNTFIFNKVLNQKLNTIIHEKSICLAINYYNYFCTNVIISLLKMHDKLDCSGNTQSRDIKFDPKKYLILKDLYIKYKTNKFFEKEYDLNNISNNTIRNKIITNIVSNVKVKKITTVNENILFSKQVYPDSIVFSGEKESINSEINKWFNVLNNNEIRYVEHSNHNEGCDDEITEDIISKTINVNKLNELKNLSIKISIIPFNLMVKSDNCAIVGENLYSNENILLEWSNIINYRSSSKFDLSDTLFIEKIYNYIQYDKVGKLNKLFTYDSEHLKLKVEGSPTPILYKFGRFRSELFECVPNLLLTIDYKIPVSLFNSDPNKKYTFGDRSGIYTPEGIFSRTKEYNTYFDYNTDINDVKYDLTPTVSLNQSASNTQDNSDLKTIYYNYNDMYKTVLDTFKLYQKCLNNLHHEQVLNDFIINLRYNHTLYYNFDNINFKIDNYTKSFLLLDILPKDIETKFTDHVEENLKNVEKISWPNKKANNYQAAIVNKTIFSFNMEKNYSEIIKDKIGNLTRIEGVFGNGDELVEKNLLPSVKVDNFSLNSNIWYYYDITSDNLCFNIRGDYDKNNSDSMYICSNNNMSHKITNIDMNNFSKYFISRLFSKKDKIYCKINHNDNIISTSDLTREQVLEIYKRYLNDLYCQIDYNVNLSSNHFGKSRSINYVTIRDIYKNENFTDDELQKIIESIINSSKNDSINLRNFLSDSEILDIRWRIVFSQSEKLSKESKFNGDGVLLDREYYIEPVFSVESNFKNNLLEHAESIDTYESKYTLKSNNLSKLFRQKLIIHLGVHDDIINKNKKPNNYRDLLIKYLSKNSFLVDLPTDKEEHIEPYIKNITPKKTENEYELNIDVNLRKYRYTKDKQNNLFVNDYKDINNKITADYSDWLQFKSEINTNYISTQNNTYFSCGMSSNLGKICNKIYEYFILGKMDGMDIKTFTYKYYSKKKFIINKYIEYIKDYRKKVGINGYFGIRFTGHSSGGAIAAGIIYIMLYKMVMHHNLDKYSDELMELEEILKQSRAYSYGAPRTFDTNTGIIISYLDKLYDLKKTVDIARDLVKGAKNEEERKSDEHQKMQNETTEVDRDNRSSSVSNNKINNIINLFSPLAMISWNNIHIGRLIYTKDNTWNDLGFKIFSIQRFMSNNNSKQFEESKSDIYNWNEGLQYESTKDSEINLFTEKCIFIPKDLYKLRQNKSPLTKEFQSRISSEPYISLLENSTNHVAINPIKTTDMVENMEFDFINDPIKAYIYENKIITTQIGYKNFGRTNDTPIVTDNIVFPFIKSWINNLTGLENHSVNRNWVRYKQLTPEIQIYDFMSQNQKEKLSITEPLKLSKRKKELEKLIDLADKCNPGINQEQSTKPECIDSLNKCAIKTAKVGDKLTNYQKCESELENIKKSSKTIYTHFEENTGYGMDRSITPGMINNTYNLLYNIRCMHYKELAVEQIEALHLYEKNNFSLLLLKNLEESLNHQIELFTSDYFSKKKVYKCFLNVILMSLYSNPFDIYIEESSDLSQKGKTFTFKLYIQNRDNIILKKPQILNFSVSTEVKDEKEAEQNAIIIYVLRYISAIRKKLFLDDKQSVKLTNIKNSVYIGLIRKLLTCIYNINIFGIITPLTDYKIVDIKSIKTENIMDMSLNKLIIDYPRQNWIFIKNNRANLVLTQLDSVFDSHFNRDFLIKYNLYYGNLYEYLLRIISGKWILFDINNQKNYIILKINQYNLYEQYISKNKLDEILSKNTSITIDKINLKSWYYKYASMNSFNSKYLPIYIFKNKIVLEEANIELPISETCFIKLNECHEYKKTSDQDFVDIKIDNETKKIFKTYLEYANFGMNKRQFGIELYFDKYTSTLTKEDKIKAKKTTEEAIAEAKIKLKIKDYDLIHSIRTNILLDSEKLKALDKDETKKIGNNIMLKISPTNIKNYITELLERMEPQSNKFIIFKILRLDNKGLLRSSISKPLNEKESSDTNIINNELFCKLYIHFENSDQLIHSQLQNDAKAELVEEATEETKSVAKAAAQPSRINKWKCTMCGTINDCGQEVCLRCSNTKNNLYNDRGDYKGFNYCVKATSPPLPPSKPSPKVKILEGGDWNKESIYDVNSLANDSNSDNDWSDSD